MFGNRHRGLGCLILTHPTMNYVHLGFKSRVPCAKLFRSVPGEDLTALDDSLEQQVQNSRGIGPCWSCVQANPIIQWLILAISERLEAGTGCLALLFLSGCAVTPTEKIEKMCIPSLHLDFISPCSRGVLKIREVTYHLFAFFTLYTSDHPLNPLSKTARSKDQC